MARILNGIAGGLGLAAIILCVLPIAESVGAGTPAGIGGQVNREFKTDRLTVPHTVAKKRSPVQTLRDEPAKGQGNSAKPELKDGCEPLFSPVTMPALAHLAGTCVG